MLDLEAGLGTVQDEILKITDEMDYKNKQGRALKIDSKYTLMTSIIFITDLTSISCHKNLTAKLLQHSESFIYSVACPRQLLHMPSCHRRFYLLPTHRFSLHSRHCRPPLCFFDSSKFIAKGKSSLLVELVARRVRKYDQPERPPKPHLLHISD
ncbi:unnamed protein product [Brassica rapa]|uniref:Uncharacterized protein n=1 Tax=Brassica campestris TaxID=3711 RepID=A0A3P5ZNR8_BRACM|nr:unnamed protein product [Brassica rapa]VDC81897.1 unnamed protein product [Brassica rapa]